MKVFSRENIPVLIDLKFQHSQHRRLAHGQLLHVGSKRRAFETKTTHAVHKMMSFGSATVQYFKRVDLNPLW